MIPKAIHLLIKKWKTLKRYIERGLVGGLVVDKKSHTLTEPHNVHYKNLQKCFLVGFALSTFADWLQGPYLYKLYADLGYSDDRIALLYFTGFASSCIFGTLVGLLADQFSRKLLCTCYGIFYILCCLAKTSSNFFILLIGRLLGGISASILFTVFEAWYVNEHMNFYKLPSEWLNMTFTKATFYNGLSAIIAGLVAQLVAEYLQFGPVSPFLLSIPVLVLSMLVIQSTWKEHSPVQTKPTTNSLLKAYFTPLKYLFVDDNLLLYFAIMQSIFEAVMYTFIVSWTPILSNLQPPLGLIFSLFMLSLMVGSRVYSWLIGRHHLPPTLLTLTFLLAAISFCLVTLALTHLLVHAETHDLEQSTMVSMSLLCFICFILYEFSVGVYYPAMGYLRSRVVPEEFRASVSNWFRVPMNLITCIILLIKEDNDNNTSDVATLKKFQFLFALCTIMLAGAIILSIIFARKYSRKIVHDELSDFKTTGKVQNSETV